MRIFILYNNSSSTLVYCCIISHHLHNIYTSHFFLNVSQIVSTMKVATFNLATCVNCLQEINPPLGKQTKCLVMVYYQLVSFQLFFAKCSNLWSNHVSPHSTMLFLIFRNFNKHTQIVMSNMVIIFHLKWFHLITLRGTPQPKKNVATTLSISSPFFNIWYCFQFSVLFNQH